jgi:phosphopantothenoylcysteine synthetase/decarboxylase
MAQITNVKPLNLKPVHPPSETPPALPIQNGVLNDPKLNIPIDSNDKKLHLLLCASGSVATIKIPNIITALSRHRNLSIRIILTPAAAQFLQGQSAEQPTLEEIAALPNVDGVYFDEDEWAEPWVRGNKILHIELRRWADLCVIAPLSADAMAKIVSGWADSLLLSVVRAWDTTGEIDPVRGVKSVEGKDNSGMRHLKRIVVAPSMNTAMWKQPVTAKHIKVLEEEWAVKNGGWFEVLLPMSKELACGDVGAGAMRDWKEIVAVIEERLGLDSDRGYSELAVLTRCGRHSIF